MQISTLLPLLALLAAPLADARDPHRADPVARRHAQHARAVEKMTANVDKREMHAQAAPKALKKRGATGCRPRGQTGPSLSSAAPSSTDAAPSPSSAAPSPSQTPNQNQDYQAPSDTPAASPTPSASPSPSPSSGGDSSSSSSSSGNNNNNNNGGGGGGGNTGSGTSFPINGIKAGLSSGEMLSSCTQNGRKVCSWYDNYQPTDPSSGGDILFIPTLWGAGTAGDFDSQRLQAFQSITDNPPIVQGFYEPDCSPPMSSSIDPSTAAGLWQSLIAPHKNSGAALMSPSLCKQAADDWLGPFSQDIGGVNWDYTTIHCNKLDMDGVNADIDHYWSAYGKPIVVTEFACVDDQNGFTPSEDQGQINNFIYSIVDLLEKDSRVVGYAASMGDGLGNTWPLFKDGQITATGNTYIDAISKYH